MVESVVAPPAERLAPYFASYNGYRLEGFAPGIHRGLPSSSLTFIVSLDEPVDIAALPDRSLPPARLRAFVGGLHAGPALIAHDGTQRGVSIDVTPLGAQALFGMPSAELASSVVALGDLLGAAGDELADRVACAPGWAERFAAFDTVLGRLVPDEPPTVRPEVAWAWHRLVRSGGQVEVGSLAKEVGWSRRHLGERFRQEVGLAPKVAARVVRFERSCRLVRRALAGGSGLADVAVRCGYYDQAHMTRDWHELAGCTPTTWLADDLPSVQDSDELAGASSRHG